MKKTIIAMLFALPLAFCSCDKDDNNQPYGDDDPITYFMCAGQVKAWCGQDTTTVFNEIYDLGFSVDERYASVLNFKKSLDYGRFTIGVRFNEGIVSSSTIHLEALEPHYSQAAIVDSVILYAGQVKRALANVGYRFGMGSYNWADLDPSTGDVTEDGHEEIRALEAYEQAIRTLENHDEVAFFVSAYGNNNIGATVEGQYGPQFQMLSITYSKQ